MSVPLVLRANRRRCGVYEGAGLAAPLIFLRFSRECEAQAERRLHDSPVEVRVQITTSDFEAVKATLAAIENKRQMLKEEDGNKPNIGLDSAIDTEGSDNTTPPLKPRKDGNN